MLFDLPVMFQNALQPFFGSAIPFPIGPGAVSELLRTVFSLAASPFSVRRLPSNRRAVLVQAVQAPLPTRETPDFNSSVAAMSSPTPSAACWISGAEWDRDVLASCSPSRICPSPMFPSPSPHPKYRPGWPPVTLPVRLRRGGSRCGHF